MLSFIHPFFMVTPGQTHEKNHRNTHRKVFIENIIDKIRQLPDEKIKEVNDFTEFLLCKIDYKIINEGIKKLTSESGSFGFLKDEEDFYTVNDLKEG